MSSTDQIWLRRTFFASLATVLALAVVLTLQVLLAAEYSELSQRLAVLERQAAAQAAGSAGLSPRPQPQRWPQ